ncbi:UD3A1 glucuronosyltransferase, partial [Amia calva]|nr:UD3A1 glucuronosyltransferase [Amia calva]
MLLQTGNPIIQGLDYVGRPNSYQITSWSASESYIKEFNDWFLEQQKEYLQGRDTFSNYVKLMGHFAYQCDNILGDSNLMDFLKREAFEMALLDAFNPCSFLLAEWLSVPYIAFFPGNLNGPQSGLPSPLSYVPVFRSQLSDQMGFWGRVKNVLLSLGTPVAERLIQAQFQMVIEHHFQPQPSLTELYRKSELWAFNTDFSLDIAQPLLPNTVCVGGLLSKPPQPVTQELEDFISGFGEAGFIVVTLGSMLTSVPQEDILQEMNEGFAGIPQAVIWRFVPSHWPQHIQPAANIKLVEWLPQNDLLGHPKARLLVTHGGLNSLFEAVYHSVPVLGIPLFGDQFDNMVKAEAKGLGLALSPTDLRRDVFTSIIKRLIGDKRLDESLWHSVDLVGKAQLGVALSQVLMLGIKALRCPRSCIGEPSFTTTEPLRVKHIDFSSSTVTTPVLEDIIGRCRELQNLSLEGLELSDGILQSLSQNPELVRLNLSGCLGFSSQSLSEMLQNCSRLEELNLSWCDFSSEHIKAVVSTLPASLTQLNLSGYRQNLQMDDVKDLVNRCPNLTDLDLSDSVLLTPDSFQYFQQLSVLEHLALSRCYQIHPAALVEFEKFPSLKTLEVFGIVQDTYLPILKKGLPHIKINTCCFTTIARPSVAGQKNRTMWAIQCRLEYRPSLYS